MEPTAQNNLPQTGGTPLPTSNNPASNLPTSESLTEANNVVNNIDLDSLPNIEESNKEPTSEMLSALPSSNGSIPVVNNPSGLPNTNGLPNSNQVATSTLPTSNKPADLTSEVRPQAPAETSGLPSSQPTQADPKPTEIKSDKPDSGKTGNDDKNAKKENSEESSGKMGNVLLAIFGILFIGGMAFFGYFFAESIYNAGNNIMIVIGIVEDDSADDNTEIPPSSYPVSY